MKSKASATWHGGLKDGGGTVSAANHAFSDVAIGFAKRFEGATGPGTTPEELIAAAHAGCFSMALSNILGQANFKADSIKTEAKVTLEKVNDNMTVTKIHLSTVAKVPGCDAKTFEAKANDAKAGCPISRLLAAAQITLDAKLA